MTRLLSAFVAAALGFALFTGGATAQEKAKDNRISYPDLIKMVENMGYETKDIGNNNFEIKYEFNGVTNYVAMNLSPDGSVVWFAAYLAEVKDPRSVPAKSWFDLVNENNKIGPSHFAYDNSNSRLYLYRPMANQDVTANRVRDSLSVFVRHLRETSNLWDGPAFATAAAGEAGSSSGR